MPRVHFKPPQRELGTAPLTIKVEENGAVFGTLRISKGRVVWRPAAAKKGFLMNWPQFAELMRLQGQPEG